MDEEEDPFEYFVIKLSVDKPHRRPRVVYKSGDIYEIVRIISASHKEAQYLESVESVDFEKTKYLEMIPGYYICECPSTDCLSVYKVKDEIREGYWGGSYKERVFTLKAKYELVLSEI